MLSVLHNNGFSVTLLTSGMGGVDAIDRDADPSGSGVDARDS